MSQLLEPSGDPPSNDPDMKFFSLRRRPSDDGVLVHRNYISMTAVGGRLSNEVGRFFFFFNQFEATSSPAVSAAPRSCLQQVVAVRPAGTALVSGIRKPSRLTWTG